MSGFSKEACLTRSVELLDGIVTDDSSVSEFFELASSGDPPLYFTSENPQDLFVLSSLARYPPELQIHHSSARYSANYGYLPLISRFYAIIDNKLFMWRTSRSTFSEQTSVHEKVITCVCAFKVASNCFTKRVKRLLAIATPTYINIHIIDDDVVKFDTFYTVSTGFVPLVMCPGNANELLIGGSDGDVYLFQFQPPVDGSGLLGWVGTQSETTTFEMKNKTWSIARLPKFLRFSKDGVNGLWFDETTGYVAALIGCDRLKFWKLTDGSMSSAGSTFYLPRGMKFVSVSPVPISESAHIRFVAFAGDGTRYFFGTTSSFFGLWTRIGLRGKREKPVELTDENVVSGFYSLGFYAIVTTGLLYIIRSTSFDSGYEIVGGTSLPGTGLGVIGFGDHGLVFLETNMYREPSIWQHFQTPPKAVVMTSDGICQLTCQPPGVELKRLLVQSNGEFSKPLKEYMEGANGSGATAIAVAALWPELQSKAISTAVKVMKKEAETEDDPNPENLTYMTRAYYSRVARILSLGWRTPLFERKPDKSFRVSYVFRNAQVTMLDQLQNVKGLIDEYKHLSESNRKDGYREELLMEIEARQLDRLNKFVDFCIEIMRLIVILSRQKSGLLTQAVEEMDANILGRLEVSAFFDPGAAVPLDEALRELVTSLYTVAQYDPCLDFLAAEIGKDCPHFSQIASVQIVEAMDNLELATRIQEDSREDLLNSVMPILLEFIGKKTINIRKICSLLLEIEEYRRAVDIVCARVAAMDDVDQGFYWWKNGCDELDTAGHEAFLRDYDCYDALFQAVHSPEGLAAIEEKDNEFLHLIVFDKLLKSGEVNILLSMKSKYLEKFIADNKDWNVRKLLYRLYQARGRYEEATEELLKLSSDAEGFSLKQRLEWLKVARSMGLEAHRKDLVDEVAIRMKCGEIQKKLSSTRSDELLGIQELFEEAERQEKWGVCLEIFNIQPPSEDPSLAIAITKMWLNFLSDSGHEEDYCETESEISTRVRQLLQVIPLSSYVLQPEYLVPAFEDTRYRLDLKPTWVVSFLTSVQINGSKLFDAYCDFILKCLPDDIAAERRNQLVYAAVWLLQIYRGDFSRLGDIVKEILNDSSSPYGTEIQRVVDKLVGASTYGEQDKKATVTDKLAMLS